MGSSYSCSVVGSKGTKKIYPRKESQKEHSNEKKSQRKHAFIWKINGFKSLLEQGEAWTTTTFKMQGFRWNLSVNPLMDSKSGDTGSKKYMSVRLQAEKLTLSPDYILEMKFKFFIQDQKEGKHIEREASHTYMKTSSLSRTSMTTSYKSALCMTPLETLKNPSLGFLVNDSIEVGVELSEVKKMKRTYFILKNKSSGLFSWYIHDFFQRSTPRALSKPFQIAGYTWKLLLEESTLSKTYFNLYLIMENKIGSKLPPSSGVMVQAVFYIKRQSQGIELADNSLRNKSLDHYQQKFVVGYNFTPSSRSWGIREFIRIGDFYDEYLFTRTWTIEASVTILGSGNDHSY